MSTPSTPPSLAGVTYSHAEEGYFEKRQLQRKAGFWGLWGLGVAAVISGEFSGWNGGLGAAGWGGLLVATILMTVMYFGMQFSIGEMSAAMPHTGGAYSFARAAMGPWGGFVTGFAETIEYVFTTAVVVYFSASYAQGVFGGGPAWMWWLILYVVFVALNAAGAEASFKFAIVVSVISVAILVFFVIIAAAKGALDFGNFFDVPNDAGTTGKFLPFGFMGIIYALPFAMWFFLGIEELPLASEEAHNPQRDVPKAGVTGLITLLVCAVLVFVFNPAVLGSAGTAASGQPVLDAFASFLPDGWARTLAAFALIGLLASLQGIMFAYARNMYSLSRAGYYPKALSLTGKTQTPYLALLVGAVIGYIALIIADHAGTTAGNIVLNIAVWGAVLSYMLQMASYVLLRRKFKNAARPYLSPVGVPGAIVAGVLALITFLGIFKQSAYHPAIIAIVIVYAVGLAAFAFFGRHRLILSPEEEYAVSGGLHRDPEVENYGAGLESELPATDFTE